MRISELFDNGQFVVTAEVGPPKGIHLEHLVEEATMYLKDLDAMKCPVQIRNYATDDLVK